MLNNVPKILSPEILATLCEMGHSDIIVLGDGNFPGARFAREGGCKFLRADGHGVCELLDAILELMPLDSYVQTPVMLMQKAECDRDMDIPIWEEFKTIVGKHDSRGTDAMGFYERFRFYDETKRSYCIIQTGEAAVYANVMLQKGVVK